MSTRGTGRKEGIIGKRVKRRRENSDDDGSKRATKRTKMSNQDVVSKKNELNRGDQTAESKWKTERALNQSNSNNKMGDVNRLRKLLMAPPSPNEVNTSSSNVDPVYNSFGVDDKKNHIAQQSEGTCNVTNAVHARTARHNDVIKRDIRKVDIRPSPLTQIRTDGRRVQPYGSGLSFFPIGKNQRNNRHGIQLDARGKDVVYQREQHITAHGYCHSVELQFEVGSGGMPIILKRDQRTRWNLEKLKALSHILDVALLKTFF